MFLKRKLTQPLSADLKTLFQALGKVDEFLMTDLGLTYLG